MLAHELLHVGLRHQDRCQGRDPLLWNVACDFVINGWLVEMQVGDFPRRGALYDPALRGESAEAIYDRAIRDIRRFRKRATLAGMGATDMLDRTPAGWNSLDATSFDAFCRRALLQGLQYHQEHTRGWLPAGLIEAIRALDHPPIPWEVALAITWAEAKAAEGAHSGIALNNHLLTIARSIGVIRPELIRIALVHSLPMPQDPMLHAAAVQTGLLGPGIVSLTLGYAVFVCHGYDTVRLFSHEFRHVYQNERAGSIAAFLPIYLAHHGIQLHEGLVLTFYSDDADEQGQSDELRVEGRIHYDPEGCCWVATIDWAAIRHTSEEVITGSKTPESKAREVTTRGRG